MEVSLLRWTLNAGCEMPPASARAANLVLAFADAAYFRQPECNKDLRRMFPAAYILGCSSSGSIHDVEISRRAKTT